MQLGDTTCTFCIIVYRSLTWKVHLVVHKNFLQEQYQVTSTVNTVCLLTEPKCLQDCCFISEVTVEKNASTKMKLEGQETSIICEDGATIIKVRGACCHFLTYTIIGPSGAHILGISLYNFVWSMMGKVV